MTKETDKSSTNGEFRISRKGTMKVAFGDLPCFTIDTIEVHAKWYVLEGEFVDADRKIDREKTDLWNQARRDYVQGMMTEAYAKEHANAAQTGQNYPTFDIPVLTLAEVGEFMARLHEEVGKLRLFFGPVTPEPPSSPSPSRVQFSQ